MAIKHLRVVSPVDKTAAVLELLDNEPGATDVIVLRGAAHSPTGDLILADLARECVDSMLERLRDLDVLHDGSISLDAPDTALGATIERAEREAPGEGADAIIWDELLSRTGQDASLTITYLAFMVLATILAAIGVVTDSTVAVVGAMVVGPEFGPLAAIAVGVLLRRTTLVRHALIALVAGFVLAIGISALATLLWRGVGLVSTASIRGHRQTEFIYHFGWFSLITALVAGAVGMLSLTASQSAALIGVFISVTTIPAAAYASVALVLGDYRHAGESLGQLAINIVGIVAAGLVVLTIQRHRAAWGKAVSRL